MFRWIINIGLLALPIGITLGILLGLQSHRDATGQGPLFNPPDDPTPKDNNGIEPVVNCQKAFGIHPKSKGQEYTLNPNQWGWDGETGGLCLNVTTWNNNTYPNDQAPEFWVTWQYPPGPETQPVHAFPNIKVEGNSLPVTLSTLSSVNLDIEWSYSVGNGTFTATDETELEDNLTNTNVAIDMFLDSDSDLAQDSTKAKYEVMVWLAAFGPATQPIGLAQGPVIKHIIEGVTFSLYYGQNSLKQYVLTWVADKPLEEFTGNLSPLIDDLTTMNRPNYPASADYLGYIGLGSEALSATKTVTFYVPKLLIKVSSTSSS